MNSESDNARLIVIDMTMLSLRVTESVMERIMALAILSVTVAESATERSKCLPAVTVSSNVTASLIDLATWNVVVMTSEMATLSEVEREGARVAAGVSVIDIESDIGLPKAF